MKIKRSISNPDLNKSTKIVAKRSISNPEFTPEQEHEDLNVRFRIRVYPLNKSTKILAMISNPDARPQVYPLNKSTKIFAKRSISNPISEVTPEQEHEDLG